MSKEVEDTEEARLKRYMLHINNTLEDIYVVVEGSDRERLTKYEKHKADIFRKRKEAMVLVDDVVVAKYFPGWRQVSKNLNRPIIMPGDVKNQYKVMMDTSKSQLVTTRGNLFTHMNGFVSICEVNKDSTHIGIALNTGKMIEVRLDEVKKVLGV